MNPTSLLRNTMLALCAAAVVLPSPPASAGAGDTRCAAEPNPCGAGRTLHIQGDFKTAIQVLPPFPSFPPDPFQPILRLVITAHGNLTHFGKATAATTDQAVDLSLNKANRHHWVFMNAKGDALWTESDLTSTPPDAQGKTDFAFVITVTGGAGRFAGASGTLAGVGSAQGDSGFFSVDGTVCVPQGTEEEVESIHGSPMPATGAGDTEAAP